MSGNCCTATEVNVGDVVTVVTTAGTPLTGSVERVAVNVNYDEYSFLIKGVWSAWYDKMGTLWLLEPAIRACGIFRKDNQ